MIGAVDASPVNNGMSAPTIKPHYDLLDIHMELLEEFIIATPDFLMELPERFEKALPDFRMKLPEESKKASPDFLMELPERLEKASPDVLRRLLEDFQNILRDFLMELPEESKEASPDFLMELPERFEKASPDVLRRLLEDFQNILRDIQSSQILIFEKASPDVLRRLLEEFKKSSPYLLLGVVMEFEETSSNVLMRLLEEFQKTSCDFLGERPKEFKKASHTLHSLVEDIRYFPRYGCANVTVPFDGFHYNKELCKQVIWKPAEKGRSSKLSKDDGQAKGEFLQMQSQEPGDCKADCQSSNLFERDNAGGAASVGGKHNTSYAAANGTGLSSGKGETLIEIGGNPEPDAPSVDDIDLARAGNIDLEAPGPSVDDIDLARAGNIDLEAPGPIDQDHEEGGNDGPDPPRRGDDGPDPPRRCDDGPDPPRSSRGLTLLVGASWLVDLQLLSTIGNLKSGGSSPAKDILCYMLMPTLACSFFFTLGGKFFRSSRMLRIGVSLTALSFLVTMVVAVL